MFMSRKFENFVCSPWIDTLSNLNNTLSNLNNPDLKKALECLCLETFIMSCLLPLNWHFIKLEQETFEGNPIVGVSGQKWNDKFFVPEIVDNCLVTFTDEISQKWWWIVKSFQNPHFACVEYVVELVLAGRSQCPTKQSWEGSNEILAFEDLLSGILKTIQNIVLIHFSERNENDVTISLRRANGKMEICRF